MASSSRRAEPGAAFRPLVIALAATLAAAGISCSSLARKNEPVLSEFVGKKIALVEIEGEKTARQVMEVALVNQLVEKGSFILVPREEVEAARAAPGLDPGDWTGLARRSGADYALRAKVLRFEAVEREGYSEEEVEDSQLAAERGEAEARTRRLYKAKSLEGTVRFELEFTDLEALAGGDKLTSRKVGIAEASDTARAEARETSARLPPKLTFLETLANQAFADFFTRYR